MALKEKVKQEDLYLYEILKNPVLFTEFIHNYDKLKYEEPFELTRYQKEMLCDFNPHVSYCCARAVGKTVSLSAILTWALVFNLFPNDYIVYTVPSKVHLEPVFTNLIRMFRSNTFLKHFIRPSGGINSGDFTVELLNKAKLMCRIAGQTGTGSNVIGLHTPLVLLDEGGYYPWGTWIEMQPIVNTWTKGYRVLVSGVPTGLRENNVLYHVDQDNSAYSKHRIKAYDNPRFSKQDEERSIEQYGGKESDDFLHFVLGLHGHPVYALFDRGNFKIGNYNVWPCTLNGLEYREELPAYISKLSVIPDITERGEVIMGIDLGYTEPTAILVMIAQDDTIKFHARIRMDKVSYPVQEKLIDYLDSKFKVKTIGMDRGNAGLGVIQSLQENEYYSHKNYRKKLIPVDFSSSTILGIDSDGTELKQKTKPMATSILQDFSNQHRIIYSSTDQEMITELERMTYTKNMNGDIIYKTMTSKGGKSGEDHFTSALLCATMAYYMTHDFSILKNKKPKLIGFSWLGA